MSIAIVLSGGGARGDFEVGALRFLYDQNVRPDIICGTSVGAINGVKLAEGEGAPDQGLQGLEAIWLELQRNEDMYVEESWLNRIDSELKDWLTGKGAPPEGPPPRNYQAWGDIGSLIETIEKAAWLVNKGAEILKMLEELSTARSLYNLGPIQRKLMQRLNEGQIRQWSQAGVRKLRLGVVSLETGQLRYVTEDGTLLERDNITPVNTVATLQPRCQQLAGELATLEAEQREAQREMHTAISPQEKAHAASQVRHWSAQIREKQSELQRCNAEDPPSLSPLKVSLESGVMASSIMPAMFPPVNLGGEWYVDGGVREVLPMQAAIDLGADTIYAIVASKAASDPKGPFNTSGLLEILARSLIDIAINEVQLNETHPAGGWEPRTVRLIQPSVDLHEPTVIDPGLISINMAYGNMRAADVVTGAGPNADRTAKIADEIATLRVETWRLECHLHGQPVPTEPAVPTPLANPALLTEIHRRKQQLQALVNERRNLGGLLPGDADTWWRNWERHPWQPFGPLWPPPGLHVWVEPSPTIPIRIPANITVRAEDNQTHAAVAGRVIFNGQDVAEANTVFAFTFNTLDATGIVRALGYADAPIPLELQLPAECAQIHADIENRRRMIDGLQQVRNGLDPRLDREEINEINARITEIRAEINNLQQRAIALGCP